MTMITPSYLGETIEYSSLHACRSTLEDPTKCYDDLLTTSTKKLRDLHVKQDEDIKYLYEVMEIDIKLGSGVSIS